MTPQTQRHKDKTRSVSHINTPHPHTDHSINISLSWLQLGSAEHRLKTFDGSVGISVLLTELSAVSAGIQW